MVAQNHLDICVTDDNDIIDPNYSTLPIDNDPEYFENAEPLVLNIYFWSVRDEFGTIHPDELNEQDALRAVQNLNKETKIFFK